MVLVHNEGQYCHCNPLDAAAFLIDRLESYKRHSLKFLDSSSLDRRQRKQSTLRLDVNPEPKFMGNVYFYDFVFVGIAAISYPYF